MTDKIISSSRLLNYSLCLLPRGIRHPPSSDIFPSVSKDKHGSASIQACSAVLAKGGICYIGDLSSYKKDKLELLQSGNLSPKKWGDRMKQTCKFKARFVPGLWPSNTPKICVLFLMGLYKTQRQKSQGPVNLNLLHYRHSLIITIQQNHNQSHNHDWFQMCVGLEFIAELNLSCNWWILSYPSAREQNNNSIYSWEEVWRRGWPTSYCFSSDQLLVLCRCGLFLKEAYTKGELSNWTDGKAHALLWEELCL